MSTVGLSLGENTQPWVPALIVDGVTCTRRETVGRLAYAVRVQAPASLRLARGGAGNDGATASCGGRKALPYSRRQTCKSREARPAPQSDNRSHTIADRRVGIRCLCDAGATKLQTMRIDGFQSPFLR